MYDLGEQFKFDLSKAKANPECIFKGNKYRITVLTERLVRLEYNENGIFEDYPTELILYRNFSKPEFVVEDKNRVLIIKTKYFELNYVKEKPFAGSKLSPTSNLKIELINTTKTWYYGHPEAKNYPTSVFSLNDTKDKKLNKSLYSLDGFVSIDDSNNKIVLENGTFKARDNKEIDIYVFLYNEDFYYCLNDYFMITGYPPLIPRYILGNLWSKNESYSEYDISHLVKKFEDNKIPLSGIILNKWNADNSFDFNEKYKNPKSIIEYLNSKSIRLGLSIDTPTIFKANTISFEKIKKYLNVDKSGNIPFNAFDARCIDAFLKILIHPLNNIGVDFYSMNTFDIKDINRLSILKHYLYYDAFKNKEKRPIIISQNYTLAPHRYPILYAGKSDVSWNTLKKIPSFNARATNLGISFISHDVGGTGGGIEDNELFVRFVELATFSPLLRLGSDSGKYYKREPWKWALKTKQISIDYLRLRHKLMPYLYTEAYKYFKYGKPLIEPIYYKYKALYDDVLYRDEYFFGSTFLISPITTRKEYLMNRVIQKLYIPDGIWYDFFTGKQYKGNRKYVSFYKDQEYPVFVKAGSIVPMSLTKGNDTKSPKEMEIVVFPGANNTYSIYEDDGETSEYLNANYLITNVEFVYEKNNYRLTILPVAGKKGIIPIKRNYKIRFKNTKPNSNVLCYISSKRVDSKVYKDDTDLIVEVSDVDTSGQFTVICSGDNIEIEAIRIISEDIVSIISDLPIKTVVKQKIDNIMFNDKLELKKKRIEIRKLAHGKDYLERKYIDLLLKLLEYLNEL